MLMCFTTFGVVYIFFSLHCAKHSAERAIDVGFYLRFPCLWKWRWLREKKNTENKEKKKTRTNHQQYLFEFSGEFRRILRTGLEWFTVGFRGNTKRWRVLLHFVLPLKHGIKSNSTQVECNQPRINHAKWGPMKIYFAIQTFIHWTGMRKKHDWRARTKP